MFRARVTCGEVKGRAALHAGETGEGAGLTGGEVRAVGRRGRVAGEEDRLDEELIRPRRERADALDIGLVIDGVDHVGDFLAGDHVQQWPQLSERERTGSSRARIAPCHRNRCFVVEVVAPGRVLEVPLPGAGREVYLVEAVLPDVDVAALLQRLGARGCAVVEPRGA